MLVLLAPRAITVAVLSPRNESHLLYPSRLFLCVFIALSGCSTAPDIGNSLSATDRAADYPNLLPLSQLLAGGGPTSTPAAHGIGGLAQLAARAQALRGPVLDAKTRAQLRAAIRRYNVQ